MKAVVGDFCVKLINGVAILTILVAVIVKSTAGRSINETKIENNETKERNLKVVSSKDDETGRSAMTYSYYYLSRRVFYFPLFYLFYFGVYIIWVLIRTVFQHQFGTLRRRRSVVQDLYEEVNGFIEKFPNKNL